MQSNFLDMALVGKFLFGLVGVLLAMGALVLLLRFLQKKRLLPTGARNSLRVIATHFISSKQKLTILQWDTTQYLVMTAGDQIAVLDKRPLAILQEVSTMTPPKTKVLNP
jgi:flagellar biogenesis protein FliO